MEKRQHSISKLLRMTPEEAKLLEEKAKQAGMTESQYLRLMISQKPNDYPEVRQLLRDLINEVNRIGVNINQITHNHNAELYSKDDKERLIAYMRKLNVAVAKVVDIPIVAVVGPEFVTGSTRMKSGTAQKLILNMISTSAMIKLGHVKGNKMVDMQLSNNKLVDRGTKMIMDETGIAEYNKAKEYLLKYGSVRSAVDAYKRGE